MTQDDFTAAVHIASPHADVILHSSHIFAAETHEPRLPVPADIDELSKVQLIYWIARTCKAPRGGGHYRALIKLPKADLRTILGQSL